MLQLALKQLNLSVLYVSGEESEVQIKMRADRLRIQHPGFYLLTATSTQTIFQEVKKIKPDLVIIDSIQTLESPYIDSSPGSISQIRECTAEFQRFAKESGTAVFVVGHVTKGGGIAGPKTLEHIVDTVLYFEGEGSLDHRVLRATKNRFGSVDEIGVFKMTIATTKVMALLPSLLGVTGASTCTSVSVVTSVGASNSVAGTWITDDMVDAYVRLAEMGHAHSIEVWAGDALVGGLYGVAIGRMFFGESMFSRVSNASKVALVHLARQLSRWSFALIDCQVATEHLASLGAHEMPRAQFIAEVGARVGEVPVPSPWVLDPDILADL